MSNARTVSVPKDVVKQLEEIQKELEQKFGIHFSFPQVITYLIKNRSK